MKSKLVVFGLATLSLLVPGSASAEIQATGQRVHAEEPTVMTVHETQGRNCDRKGPKGQRRATRLLGSVMSFPGWALNVSDDIPSPRERRSRLATEQTSPDSAITRVAQ